MIRKIKFEDLESAVNRAYEKLKDNNEGVADNFFATDNENAFGIAVVLADGRVIKRGDADMPVAMDSIAKVPVSTVLLTQYTPDEVIRKSGYLDPKDPAVKKAKVPTGRHGLRELSAIEPQGDGDGKMDILSERLTDLMGVSPVLDDRLYKAYLDEARNADTVNVLAASGYYLYDDAELTVDIYSRLRALKASATQLATMGATIAADGFNPLTKENVFDGVVSAPIVAMMAVKGPHKMSKPWLVGAGIPAKNSRAGAMAGVLPGVMGIAAVSPRLNEAGIPVKAALAIKEIANELQFNVFNSARIEIE